MTGTGRPQVAVVGVHGYGAWHVGNALRLQEQGVLRLAALVDPRGGPVLRDRRPVPGAEAVPRYTTLEELLRTGTPDVVVIATPLHTHCALARQSLAAGADVLLEKPPVTNAADFQALRDAEVATGAAVQVAFQALGSHAHAALHRAMREGSLGEIRRVGAAGCWTRDQAYWRRAPWAGRRRLDGAEVLDGALSNPFAHAVVGALHLAGRQTLADVGAVEVELFSANSIEADDTSSFRVAAARRGGVYDGPVTGAFTLAGPREASPYIDVVGSELSARLYYAQDRIVTSAPEHPLAGGYGRVDLLGDLIARSAGGGPLRAPLSTMGGLVAVLEAVRAATPRAIPSRHMTWRGSGAAAAPVLAGIEDLVARAVDGQLLLGEAGAPWA